MKHITFYSISCCIHYSHVFCIICMLESISLCFSHSPIRCSVLRRTGHQFHQVWGPLHLSPGDTGAAASLPATLGGVHIHQVGSDLIAMKMKKEIFMSNHCSPPLLLRPAVASYVSLAFGRYVVEPFFAPCAAPTVLIKLVSILGVSEWFLFFLLLPTTPVHRSMCP